MHLLFNSGIVVACVCFFRSTATQLAQMHFVGLGWLHFIYMHSTHSSKCMWNCTLTPIGKSLIVFCWMESKRRRLCNECIQQKVIRSKQIGDTINKVMEREKKQQWKNCSLLYFSLPHIWPYLCSLWNFNSAFFDSSLALSFSFQLFVSHSHTHFHSVQLVYLSISLSRAISSSASICYCQFHTSILSTLKSYFESCTTTAFNTYIILFSHLFYTVTVYGRTVSVDVCCLCVCIIGHITSIAVTAWNEIFFSFFFLFFLKACY